MFRNLDDSSGENIRKHVGAYNSHFTKPGEDQDVIFTQPYLGSQGLGIRAKSFLYTIIVHVSCQYFVTHLNCPHTKMKNS